MYENALRSHVSLSYALFGHWVLWAVCQVMGLFVMVAMVRYDNYIIVMIRHTLVMLRHTAMGARVQALQYLSKLCSHPLLVLDPANPVHVEAVEKATQLQASSPAAWKAIQPNLHQLHHAPKLEQLKQLLQVS